MMNLTKRLRPITIITLALLSMVAVPALAQSHDLAGQWSLESKGAEVRVELSPLGNAWVGKALSETALDLKLNPAGLRNQWVGNLNYLGKHRVKAESKGKDTLLITDLDDKETWTLIRSKLRARSGNY